MGFLVTAQSGCLCVSICLRAQCSDDFCMVTLGWEGKGVGRLRRDCALVLVLICLCGATALNQVGTARAQAPNQAALVVRYGDGTIWTGCVTFAEAEITGLELLQRAGLEVVYARGGTGDLLCKIGPEGCDNPNQCLCKCSGAECAYWSYWHQQDGQWQYSVVGASSYRVKPGTIDGWVWGTGTTADAPRPPALRFEQLCRLLTPTATPTLTGTPTPMPSPTASPSAAPATSVAPQRVASPTASATAMPKPSPTAMAVRPTASAALTPAPTATQQPSPTPIVPATATPPVRSGEAAYIVFAAIVVLLSAIGVIAWRRGRVRS